MKKKIQILMALSVIAFIFMPSSTTIATISSPFIGHWQGVDDADGSDIRLTIAGPPQGPFSITWTESYFSGCQGEAGIAKGTGNLNADGSELTAEITLRCFTTGREITFSITWIYDHGTDTISSDFITWHRPKSSSQACQTLPAGLTAWWPGDGDPSELISGRDGEFVDNATTASGLVDLAFKLDGDSDFIEVPDSAGLNFGPLDFTVELWVNFTDTNGEQVLIEKWVQGDDDTFVDDGWTLTKLETNVLRLAVEAEDGSHPALDSQEALDIHPGIWYHFAATRQGSLFKLYMNGNIVAEETLLYVSDLNTPASLKFGHRGSPDTRGFYLNGRLDEVKLYIGTALSGEQIQAIYNAGSAGTCKDAIPPKLDLRVCFGEFTWVESFYEPGHVVKIKVTGSDAVTVKAMAEMVTEPREAWNGETGFHIQEEDWVFTLPDIQPNDWVIAEMDNGATAQVKIGNINGVISTGDDNIKGTIYAPWFYDEMVLVECHLWILPEPDMKYDEIKPDDSDQYLCSWVGEYDLQSGWIIGPSYYGPDGHWVANGISVP